MFECKARIAAEPFLTSKLPRGSPSPPISAPAQMGSPASSSASSSSLMWFRKGLRIHDNPALQHAASRARGPLYPVFVIDPRYMEPDRAAFSPGSPRAGVNRIRFLLECLADLDAGLRRLGSRLLVLKGEPGEVLIRCLDEVMKYEFRVTCMRMRALWIRCSVDGMLYATLMHASDLSLNYLIMRWNLAVAVERRQALLRARHGTLLPSSG